MPNLAASINDRILTDFTALAATHGQTADGALEEAMLAQIARWSRNLGLTPALPAAPSTVTSLGVRGGAR